MNTLPIPRTHRSRRAHDRLGHRSLAMAWAALAWLAVGCASPEQESDWRWKQFNPDYRPPLPPADMGR